MSNELIIELWAGIKPLIPAKERIHVADKLISMFDDHGYADGIEHEVGLDKVLAAAVATRFDLYGDEEIDFDDDEFHNRHR